METTNGININKVADDLLAIRHSILNFEIQKEGSIDAVSYKAQLLLMKITMGLCAAFVFAEIFLKDFNSFVLLNNTVTHTEKLWAVSGLIVFVLTCLVIHLVTVRAASKKSVISLNEYIKRNFNYLHQESHLSDLIIKTAITIALIFADKQYWIAPFLFMFTADYLIQGRFFIFKRRKSILLALITLCMSGGMFYMSGSNVVLPIIWYFILTALCHFDLQKLRRIEV